MLNTSLDEVTPQQAMCMRNGVKEIVGMLDASHGHKRGEKGAAQRRICLKATSMHICMQEEGTSKVSVV